MAAHTFPTILVREGIQDLALPDGSGFFDPNQSKPVTDLQKWFDDFYSANPFHIGQNIHERKTWVKLNPTHTLGILAINRYLPDDRRHPAIHEVVSYPRTAGPDDYPLLRVIEDRNSAYHTIAGSHAFSFDIHNQHATRTFVQSRMRAILEDLGYGTPEEFAEKAVPLDTYQSERDIVWPPVYNTAQ